MPNTNSEYGKNREEKIDKFLDMLTWFHSSKPAMDFTAKKIERLSEKIDVLNKNIVEASQSSERLSASLNKLTFWGVFVAFLGLIFAIFKFLFENKIWQFIQ